MQSRDTLGELHGKFVGEMLGAADGDALGVDCGWLTTRLQKRASFAKYVCSDERLGVLIAYVDDGDEAIASSVAASAPPNPTAKSTAPEAFTRAADAIAVLSLPPTVCSPSVSTIITCGAPERTFAGASVVSPVSRPPDRNVQPPADRLSIAVLI